MCLKTEYQNVYGAWQVFRKGKQASRSIDEFAYYLEENIANLAEELTDILYKHGAYHSVVLHEKKRRDLAVATVRDRVVHRLLYDYLVQLFDKGFDPDVWSCRKNKGLHKCLTRTQKLLSKYPYSYVWRADITKFFDNVQHAKLLSCLKRKIGDDKHAMWLCREVISSYNLYRTGIPIGNLTSQIFANIYLNECDRFVRHTLKPQAYVRYGDDFILFAPTRQSAFRLRHSVQQFLKNKLGLRLNPKSDIIIPASSGLHFLGHVITQEVATVDAHTTVRVLEKVNHANIASYRALYLEPEVRRQLDWILLEKEVDAWE